MLQQLKFQTLYGSIKEHVQDNYLDKLIMTIHSAVYLFSHPETLTLVQGH